MRVWSMVGMAVLFAMAGCLGDRPRATPVGGHRDAEAVTIRIHNRTASDVIIKAYVRERMRSVPLNDLLKLPAYNPDGPFMGTPDLEVPLFAALPIKPENIGVYSVEISTPETEARLGIIDIPSQEMLEAKEFGRLTLIFREASINVQIGNKRRVVPWLRAVPRPRVRTTF